MDESASQCTPRRNSRTTRVEINLSANSPFVIGVSGHRDLDPDGLSRTREAVTNFVQNLKQNLPDTDLRFVVGMAEGADLLIAQMALDLGLRVDAVLPMPFEHYAADFDAAGLELLKVLLQHPRIRCVELRLAHVDLAAGPCTPAERDMLYANLSETLIRRSSLLLALWDGHPSALPGGTADTVLKYLGVRSEENTSHHRVDFVDAPHDLEWESRLVYWIPTNRRGSAVANTDLEPCFVLGIGDNTLQVQSDMPSRLKAQLTQLNDYNRSYEHLRSSGIGTPDSLLANLPADVPLHDRQTLEEIDAQYGKADLLAIHYQKHSERLFALFGMMAFVMGLAYLIYEKLVESKVVLISYLILLVASVLIYYRLQGKEWFAKHLICRMIAETMRARFYVTLAGTDHLVDAEEVLALSGIDKFRGFSWIGHVLKGVGAIDRHPHHATHDSRRARYVDQAWIESQHQYFKKRVTRLENSSTRVKWLKNIVFVVIICVIVAVELLGGPVHQTSLNGSISVKNLFTFGMGVLVVLLGVLELHQNKMATRELLWQYRNQLGHFSRARLQLSRIAAPSKRRQVLAELGKESLMESCLWTIHRYHREHEPPHGH
jgi:hypothetical protein